ncbi:POZ [Glarea lozoyensis ATCC 20868]|uniref:POZ n=1 Tax=Glarea lozoyensis (strain ATCC 20868 / MF5171) TaxID=1116229 RepID=S3DFM3_GLAL2|nr:POZ [Glarea lozoyensis ATCC 20868]EPE30761.1 POZ [Glarea lozoyensis ATCC 20868]
MFSRNVNKSQTESFSRKRREAKGKSSFRDHAVSKSRHERSAVRRPPGEGTSTLENTLTASIITLVVGREQRLFAAHEDVLCHSPFFQAACRGQFLEATNKRVTLPDEEPEIFSSVLEYLYKGDYYPRLMHNKRKNTWELETAEGGCSVESTVYHHGVDGELLKDTVIYCTAEKYGLEELKRVALKKQGLQSGIQCSTILSSARYAYANTPDNDSKLRAHYLALIIRSRGTFKRSGTMQMEMQQGGSQLFFDLFVALCNHVDDVSSVAGSPRSVRTHH